MNDKCLEPGIIQAFLDGEAAPELSFTVTRHTAECDACAVALAQADEENAQAFALLDREMNVLVPTQRLWSSISVALAEEKDHSFWGRVRRGILAAFANPSFAAAASVLLLFSVFAAVWTLRSPAPPELANTGSSIPSAADAREIARAPNPVDPDSQPTASKPMVQVGVTDLRPDEIGKLARNATYRQRPRAVRAEPAVIRNTVAPRAETAVYLPGEESYIRTIANLKESVDSRKDRVMSPSVRISYERDMAVVNDSIDKMKDVVRKNPKNQAARQVLYSSYQNKIDLLNSIVSREELMASMQ
ncbi:MAG: hypothetical protein AB7F88_12575 [Pyrinomonadaceae bacterium]